MSVKQRRFRTLRRIALFALVLNVPIVIALFASRNKLPSREGTIYYDTLPPSESDLAFYIVEASWETTNLTYQILNCPATGDCAAAQQAVRDAAASWDAASGLVLQEVPDGGDIQISWRNDIPGRSSGFDGPGTILAYTNLPRTDVLGDLAGDVYFDIDEFWVTGTPVRRMHIHLKTVALHEFGHALGLGHSSNPASVMWAEYLGPTNLHFDDLEGIQSMYGQPEVVPTPQVETVLVSEGVTAYPQYNIRLRSGPGEGFEYLTTIPFNTPLTVVNKNSDASWLLVEYEGQQGWIAAWLCNIEGDLASIQVYSDEATQPE